MTFWYVYKRGGGAPRRKHSSYEAAVLEAARLMSYRGGEYEVLRVEAIVRPAPSYIVDDVRPEKQEPPF